MEHVYHVSAYALRGIKLTHADIACELAPSLPIGDTLLIRRSVPGWSRAGWSAWSIGQFAGHPSVARLPDYFADNETLKRAQSLANVHPTSL